MTDQLNWRKSSYSGQTGGDCVEVAQTSDAEVRVRDSKRTDGPQFAFTATAWTRFVVAAAGGELDGVQ
ncbi:DUF397 domain-containing protein [Streptomyces sp. NPDC057654]|uniref:DUF397 domain-containing protein n=1 Tax=Streptomyces sp. NPDC057654 TaxID=3346196 RepID=UPI0036B3342D